MVRNVSNRRPTFLFGKSSNRSPSEKVIKCSNRSPRASIQWGQIPNTKSIFFGDPQQQQGIRQISKIFLRGVGCGLVFSEGWSKKTGWLRPFALYNHVITKPRPSKKNIFFASGSAPKWQNTVRANYHRSSIRLFDASGNKNIFVGFYPSRFERCRCKLWSGVPRSHNGPRRKKFSNRNLPPRSSMYVLTVWQFILKQRNELKWAK